MDSSFIKYSRLVEQFQSKGWPELFGSLVHAVSTAMPLDDAQQLMTSAGLHMSRSMSMPNGMSVEDGEERMNFMLASHGLGLVKLETEAEDMLIMHFGFPPLVGPNPELSVELVCAFLGGMHYGLFTSIGLDASAEVSVEISRDDPLTAEIRFSV